MPMSKKLVYAHLLVTGINALFQLLGFLQVYPYLCALVVLVLSLCGLTWLTYQIHRVSLRRKQQERRQA